jgi:dienelactone hydrolase
VTEPISLRNPGFYGVRDYTIGGVGPILEDPGSVLEAVEPSVEKLEKRTVRRRLAYPDVPDLFDEGFRVRVFFPSWDGAVWSAPIAEGTYPLVVFMHGQRDSGDGICPPDITNDYQRWWAALFRLATTGVIVAVPDLSGVVSADPTTVVPRLQQTIHFIRNVWENSASVSSRLGLAGHSWGANAAINAAVSGALDVQAYASVAVTRENNYGNDYRALRIPTLLIAGMEDLLGGPLGTQSFDMGPTPRYQVALEGIDHWGWFARTELQRCDGSVQDCRHGAWIVSEMLASFFARHLNGDAAVVPYLLETPVNRTDLSSLNDSPCAAKVIFRTSSAGNSWVADLFTSETVGWGPVPWTWKLFGRWMRREVVTIGTWSGSSPF